MDRSNLTDEQVIAWAVYYAKRIDGVANEMRMLEDNYDEWLAEANRRGIALKILDELVHG